MMQHQVPEGSRRGIRRSVKLDCELVSSREDEPLRFAMTDLSPFGMWVQTADPVRAGEQVVVCFEPRDVEPVADPTVLAPWALGEIMVFAEVARVATSRRRVNEPGVGMGLEFLDLTGDEREAIDRWLRPRRAPIPRRRRPTPRFRVAAPVMTRCFDEIRGTTAVQPVHPPSVATESDQVCAVGGPLDFRPLQSAWR